MASHNHPNSAGRGNLVINIMASELRRQREAEIRRRSHGRLQRVEEPSIPLSPTFPPVGLSESFSIVFSMTSNNHPNSAGRGNPVINITTGELGSQREVEIRRRSHGRFQRVEEPSIPLTPSFPPVDMPPSFSMVFSRASHNHPNSAGRGNPVINITASELRRQREAEIRRRSHGRLQRVEEPSNPLPPTFPPGRIVGENLSSSTSLRNRMFYPNNSFPIEGMSSHNLIAELSGSHTRRQAQRQSVPLPPTFPPGITLGEHLFSTESLRNHIFSTTRANLNLPIDQARPVVNYLSLMEDDTITVRPNLPVDQARVNINNSSTREGMNLQHLDLQEINSGSNNVEADARVNIRARNVRRQREAELDRSHTKLQRTDKKPLISLPPPSPPPGITLQELPFSAKNNSNIGPNLSTDKARPNISNSCTPKRRYE